MIKRKQNKTTINDQKEIEQKDYQWSKRNRTKGLSMIKRKQNTKTINDQKETEQNDYQWSKGNRTNDYQWSKGNRTQRLLMITGKKNNTIISTEKTKAWETWILLKTKMNTCGWHRRMDTSCSNNHASCVTEQKDYQWSKGNRTKRLSMIKR